MTFILVTSISILQKSQVFVRGVRYPSKSRPRLPPGGKNKLPCANNHNKFNKTKRKITYKWYNYRDQRNKNASTLKQSINANMIRDAPKSVERV